MHVCVTLFPDFEFEALKARAGARARGDLLIPKLQLSAA